MKEPIRHVEVTDRVLMTLMTHALTNEGEEIMGLLLGNVHEDDDGRRVNRIWMASPQIRTDRRKDRVECSPEQTARTMQLAESLSHSTGIPTRVIGWYHSHPHITVQPSHVDVRTQASYQMLDVDFVGLIFSVFNQDAAAKASKIQMTAFQSQDSSYALSLSPEDPQYLPSTLAAPSLELTNSMRLDAQILAAIRASKAEAEAGTNSLVRRDVSIKIVECANEVERTTSLQDVLAIHHTLFLEEQQSFSQGAGSEDADGGMMDGSWVDGLNRLSKSLAYQQALCRLIGTVLVPSIDCLRMQDWQAKVQARQIQEEKEGTSQWWLQKEQGEIQPALNHQQQPQSISEIKPANQVVASDSLI